MRKLTALLLVLVLALGVTLSASAELAPMTTDEITLVFGGWDLGDEDYRAVMERSVAAFMEAYPNITVELMRTLSFFMNTMASNTNAVAGQGIAAASSLLMFLPNLILFILMQSRVMNTMAYSGLK